MSTLNFHTWTFFILLFFIQEKENQMGVVMTKKNILSDEDEVDFESCCGAETLAFILPPKKFKINIALHASLSGKKNTALNISLTCALIGFKCI